MASLAGARDHGPPAVRAALRHRRHAGDRRRGRGTRANDPAAAAAPARRRGALGGPRRGPLGRRHAVWVRRAVHVGRGAGRRRAILACVRQMVRRGASGLDLPPAFALPASARVGPRPGTEHGPGVVVPARGRRRGGLGRIRPRHPAQRAQVPEPGRGGGGGNRPGRGSTPSTPCTSTPWAAAAPKPGIASR